MNFPFLAGTLETAIPEALTNQPRKHTYYLAIWITAGSGEHIIDFESYPIERHALYFVRPQQVQLWQITKPVTGYYALFDEEIFHVYGANRFFKQLSFLTPFERSPIFYFNDQSQADLFQNLFIQIRNAFRNNKWGQGAELISWLQLLCVYTERIFTEGEMGQELSVGQRMTRRFLELVDSYATKEQNLTFYAKKLGVTVGHLTETVAAMHSVPAGALLRQQRMLEAKRLLAYTDLTAAEISQQLSYADRSYFGRAFKRETGHTPRNFRQQYRQE